METYARLIERLGLEAEPLAEALSALVPTIQQKYGALFRFFNTRFRIEYFLLTYAPPGSIVLVSVEDADRIRYLAYVTERGGVEWRRLATSSETLPPEPADRQRLHGMILDPNEYPVRPEPSKAVLTLRRLVIPAADVWEDLRIELPDFADDPVVAEVTQLAGRNNLRVMSHYGGPPFEVTVVIKRGSYAAGDERSRDTVRRISPPGLGHRVVLEIDPWRAAEDLAADIASQLRQAAVDFAGRAPLADWHLSNWHESQAVAAAWLGEDEGEEARVDLERAEDPVSRTLNALGSYATTPETRAAAIQVALNVLDPVVLRGEPDSERLTRLTSEGRGVLEAARHRAAQAFDG